MTNTERYFNNIRGFRDGLRKINARYAPEYDRLEKFKDSAHYANDKKLMMTAAMLRSTLCAGNMRS